MRRIFALITFLFVIIAATARTDVRLPNIFGDNMVLQRDKPVVIWGWAARGKR